MKGDYWTNELRKNSSSCQIADLNNLDKHSNFVESQQSGGIQTPKGKPSIVSLRFFHDSLVDTNDCGDISRPIFPSKLGSQFLVNHVPRCSSARRIVQVSPRLRRGATGLMLGKTCNYSRVDAPQKHISCKGSVCCAVEDNCTSHIGTSRYWSASSRIFSATTPTGHLTQSDLIQSLDSRNEDCRASSDSTAGLDTSRRSKGRNHDLDRRPPSHNAMKSIQLSNGRVPPPLLDTSREFEGMRLQNSLDDKSLSHRKSGYFKPNGLRSAFNEKFSQNGTGQEDLVATGTILNSVPSTSSKPLSKSFNSVVGGNHSSVPAFSTSTSVGHSTRSTRLSLQRPPLQTNYQRQQKQTSEPKYADPLNGAEVVFQQRLAELATLEADTVRWERNRKMKKKNRDRDS